jgi:hypothetical protein
VKPGQVNYEAADGYWASYIFPSASCFMRRFGDYVFLQKNIDLAAAII